MVEEIVILVLKYFDHARTHLLCFRFMPIMLKKVFRSTKAFIYHSEHDNGTIHSRNEHLLQYLRCTSSNNNNNTSLQSTGLQNTLQTTHHTEEESADKKSHFELSVSSHSSNKTVNEIIGVVQELPTAVVEGLVVFVDTLRRRASPPTQRSTRRYSRAEKEKETTTVEDITDYSLYLGGH